MCGYLDDLLIMAADRNKATLQCAAAIRLGVRIIRVSRELPKVTDRANSKGDLLGPQAEPSWLEADRDTGDSKLMRQTWVSAREIAWFVGKLSWKSILPHCITEAYSTSSIRHSKITTAKLACLQQQRRTCSGGSTVSPRGTRGNCRRHLHSWKHRQMPPKQAGELIARVISLAANGQQRRRLCT